MATAITITKCPHCLRITEHIKVENKTICCTICGKEHTIIPKEKQITLYGDITTQGGNKKMGKISKKTLTPMVKVADIGEEPVSAEIIGADTQEDGTVLLLFKIGKKTYKKFLKERLIQLVAGVLGDETDNWTGAKVTLFKNVFDKDGEPIEYVDIQNIEGNQAAEERV
jgi:hypothetical protein